MESGGWMNSPSASSVWADVLVGDDTVRVFNNHLHSTAINAADNEYITEHRFLSDTARETKIRSIVERLRENSVLRAAQVDSIARVVGETRTRRIICGDFNDTPASYAYHTVRGKRLRDAFVAKGRGLQGTYGGFFNMFRLDYILTDREAVEVLHYYPFDVVYSDHMPVAAAVALTGADA